MQNKKNILDKLVDEFSQTELKKRVWLIAAIGFVICAITVLAAYFFFSSEFVVKYGETPIPYWKMLWLN